MGKVDGVGRGAGAMGKVAGEFLWPAPANSAGGGGGGERRRFRREWNEEAMGILYRGEEVLGGKELRRFRKGRISWLPAMEASYQPIIYPVPGEHDWSRTSGPDIEPPKFHVKRGRKKEKRIKGRFEVPKPKDSSRMTTITCSNCGLQGHMYTNYRQQLRLELALRKNKHVAPTRPRSEGRSEPPPARPTRLSSEARSQPPPARPTRPSSEA
ncbi:translation initiation factor IF-2-like [Hordeum vulgare]|nr:translation initiation factor IF-2-like [Hordeum vulgare]